MADVDTPPRGPATAEVLIERAKAGRGRQSIKLVVSHYEVLLDNLQHRLDLVTGDPETLEARLLSKHNALRMASASIAALRTLLRDAALELRGERWEGTREELLERIAGGERLRAGESETEQ